MKYFIVLLLCVYFLSGCVSLDSEERKILNTYKKGDVLIFNSLKTDSVIKFEIVNIESSILAGSEAEFMPHIDAKIEYRPFYNQRSKRKLLSIYKNREQTNIILNFENFFYDISNDIKTQNFKTLKVGSKKFENVYVCNLDTNRFPVWNDDDVLTIFWQKDIGIIKYDFNNGDSYIRTNL